MKNYKKELLKIIDNTDNNLKKHVAQYFIDKCDDNEDIKNSMLDVLNYGCANGVVSDLVYFEDTKKFYFDYENEINDIIEDLEQEGIEPLANIKTPVSNYLAWLGFEEMTRTLVNDLGIDY